MCGSVWCCIIYAMHLSLHKNNSPHIFGIELELMNFPYRVTLDSFSLIVSRLLLFRWAFFTFCLYSPAKCAIHSTHTYTHASAVCLCVCVFSSYLYQKTYTQIHGWTSIWFKAFTDMSVLYMAHMKSSWVRQKKESVVGRPIYSVQLDQAVKLSLNLSWERLQSVIRFWRITRSLCMSQSYMDAVKWTCTPWATVNRVIPNFMYVQSNVRKSPVEGGVK